MLVGLNYDCYMLDYFFVDDPDDVCLRHSLANLVAVVVAIGGPCHLYYHMFEADQLLDTFVTGFMVCVIQHHHVKSVLK